MLEHEPFTNRIIGCAIDIHRALGPGLPEAMYEEALCIELELNDIPFLRQIGIPTMYKGRLIGEHRPDLVVGGQVVVEIKSVERLAPVHQAQLLAYMRVLKVRYGLLINFNTDVVRSGIKRM